MPYHVKVAGTKVEKQLGAIPEPDQDRIVEKIRTLSLQPRPRGIQTLATNVYRLRIGRFRVIYKVFDPEQVILVGKIVLRSERTYKDIETLFK